MRRNLTAPDLREFARNLSASHEWLDRVSIGSGSIRMDGDNISVGALSFCNRPRGRSETILSVVVPDRNQNDGDEKKKRIFTPSIVEYVKVLSLLYAIVMTIIGLVFPISEALTNTWLDTTYNAVFTSYQLIVGTVFLIYLQIFVLIQKKTNRRKSTINKNAASSKNGQQDNRDEPGFQDEYYSAASANNNNSNVPNDNDTSNYLSPPSITFGQTISSAVTRFRNRVNLAEEDCSRSSTPTGSPPLTRRQKQLQKRLSVDFDRITEDDGSSSGPSVVWMDVSKFGSIFNHEGSSLFLKVGSLVFSLGNVIYYSLEIENSMNRQENCTTGFRFGWTFILRLIFVLVQTFFIFKGPEIPFERHLPIVWFGMLHLVSTNICLWFRIVIREIMEEYRYDTSKDNPTDNLATNNVTSTTLGSFAFDYDLSCENELLHAASRYLFPFVLEYSLIAVGTVACIVQCIAEPTDSEGHLAKGLKNLIKVCSFQSDNEDDKSSAASTSSGHSHRSILSKSHGGMFVGALLFAGIIVAIVLFYFYSHTSQNVIYLVGDLVLHSCLLIGCCLALILIRPLAYVAKPLSTDDALLIIAMCGSTMYEISIIIASSVDLKIENNSVTDEEALRLSASLVACVQTLVQTMLILCAVRRYPSTEDHVTRMPGRGTFTFLIVGNISVWVFRTALTKTADMTTAKDFYGPVPWLLLMNLNLPLLLFFRFHCSVCFADVWHIAYTPLHRKLRKIQKATRRQSISTIANQAPNESSLQIPQICIISPQRRQSSGNILDEYADTVSLGSVHSSAM